VGGLTVGDLAYWADSVLLWYLIRIGEAPFDAVLVDTENQLAHTFQVSRSLDTPPLNGCVIPSGARTLATRCWCPSQPW
jgi:hypothetical protein